MKGDLNSLVKKIATVKQQTKKSKLWDAILKFHPFLAHICMTRNSKLLHTALYSNKRYNTRRRYYIVKLYNNFFILYCIMSTCYCYTNVSIICFISWNLNRIPVIRNLVVFFTSKKHALIFI